MKTPRAIIQGGTSGMGLAIAKSLADRGIPLILVGRTESKLAKARLEITQEANVPVETWQADVTD